MSDSAAFDDDTTAPSEAEVETETTGEAVTEEELLGASAGLEVVDDASADDEDADEEPPAPKPESPYDRPGRWYVIHSYAGYENKVKSNIGSMIASLNLEEKVFEVVIPMEEVIEFKNGKKQVVQKKLFPGYLLLRADLDEDTWFHIRNTPGVTGFAGPGAKPLPLSRREVENILRVEEEGPETAPKKTKPSIGFEVGETVRVKEGPFADFTGQIIELNEDQLRVKVAVNIFGRETPVELEFHEIAKL